MHQTYEKVKLEANNTIPGGLHMLESIKGEPIDELSGYNRLQSKIDDIQVDAMTHLDAEKEGILKQINSR